MLRVYVHFCSYLYIYVYVYAYVYVYIWVYESFTCKFDCTFTYQAVRMCTYIYKKCTGVSTSISQSILILGFMLSYVKHFGWCWLVFCWISGRCLISFCWIRDNLVFILIEFFICLIPGGVLLGFGWCWLVVCSIRDKPGIYFNRLQFFVDIWLCFGWFSVNFH